MKEEKKVSASTAVTMVLLLLIFLVFSFLVLYNMKDENVENKGETINYNISQNFATEDKKENTISNVKNINNTVNNENSITDSGSNSIGSTSLQIKKTGDIINVNRLALAISVENSEKSPYDSLFTRAKITIKNNNTSDFENDMLNLVLKKMISIIADKNNLNEEEPILGTVFADYSDNILGMSLKSGQEITGYIYWSESFVSADYIKIKPIDGSVEGDELFSYGTPYYINLK